jgi:hypothetical protein
VIGFRRREVPCSGSDCLAAAGTRQNLPTRKRIDRIVVTQQAEREFIEPGDVAAEYRRRRDEAPERHMAALLVRRERSRYSLVLPAMWQERARTRPSITCYADLRRSSFRSVTNMDPRSMKKPK